MSTEHHIADAESIFFVMNVGPDFCKVGKKVVPFDISQTLDPEKNAYSVKTFSRSEPILLVGSIIESVVGNAGKGVRSKVSLKKGDCKVIEGSATVIIENRMTARDGDLVYMNMQFDAAPKASDDKAPAKKDSPKKEEKSAPKKPANMVITIGGAGDKEPFYTVGPSSIVYKQVTVPLAENFEGNEDYNAVYLGYNEVRSPADIERYITSNVDPSTSIYIVGHSLGGWNGAELSRTLADQGYDVRVLVTLDPVGDAPWTPLVADIPFFKPNPGAEQWINIHASPTNGDASDLIATAGGRWVVVDGTTINLSPDINHANAGAMFVSPLLNDGRSVLEYITDEINKPKVPKPKK
jgi:hypothetical protein